MTAAALRIDGDAAIDGAHDALHADLAVFHRHLRHLRNDAAERLMQGHAMRMAGAFCRMERTRFYEWSKHFSFSRRAYNW